MRTGLEFYSEAEARVQKAPPTEVPGCDRCKLYQACKSPKMKAEGRGERGILIVGDYPGKDEDFYGRPMAGGTGRYLRDTLQRMGVNPTRDCRITNAQICYDVAGRKPAKATEDCRPHLLREIRDFDPRVIILMGGAAISSVIGHLWRPDVGLASRWFGKQIPAHKPNVWVCPMTNPASLFYEKASPVAKDIFESQLEAALALEDRPWPDGPPDYASQVRCIYDPSEAAQVLDKYTSGQIAFDYETTTLKPDGPHAEVVCCSVCWEGKETIAYPWVGPAREATRKLLENPDVGKIGWNAVFEDRWSRERLGINVRGWIWDGLLAAHLLDPQSGVTGTGLKFNAFCYLGMSEYNSHVEPFLDSGKSNGGNAPNRIREVDLRTTLLYCGLDSLLEWEVTKLQMKEMGYGN